MFKKLLSLLSDAAVYGVSSMLSRLVGLLLMPILTVYIPTEEYGKVFMLALVTTVFVPMGNLGMTNSIFRRFNLDKDPAARAGVLSTGLVSVTLSSLLLMAIGLIFAAPLTRVLIGEESATPLMRLSLLTAAATAVGMVPFVSLRAGRRVKTAAAVNVGKVLISMRGHLVPGGDCRTRHLGSGHRPARG